MKSFQFPDGVIVGGVTLLYGESDIVDPQSTVQRISRSLYCGAGVGGRSLAGLNS